MIRRVYIEEGLAGHARAQRILARLPHAERIPCRSYSEVFNPVAQNFRLQKRSPALILARRSGRFLLPTPAGYTIGGTQHFYFSHLLNCPYDCRYCFLQGMYRAAHYLLFVNYEDFAAAIVKQVIASGKTRPHFFSGYDGDSLALEPLSGFAGYFLPLFRSLHRRCPGALLELRTKSVQIRALLAVEPADNCVVAFSLSPAPLQERWERGVPTLARQLQAMRRLQRQGWRLGLRFDPVLYHPDFRALYGELFLRVFEALDAARLHSVTLGCFRLPGVFFQRMQRLYPEEPLFARYLDVRRDRVGYSSQRRAELLDWCRTRLSNEIPPDILFVQDEPAPAKAALA